MASMAARFVTAAAAWQWPRVFACGGISLGCAREGLPLRQPDLLLTGVGSIGGGFGRPATA
ncbi:unnamed protein product [Urochloa humidicola]